MHWIKRSGNETIVAIILMDFVQTQKLIISSEVSLSFNDKVYAERMQ